MPSLASTARTTAHTSHSVSAGHRARLGRVPDARLPAASRIRAGRVFATGEAAISSSTVDAGEVYSIQSVRDDGEAVVNTAAWLEARSAGDGCIRVPGPSSGRGRWRRCPGRHRWDCFSARTWGG